MKKIKCDLSFSGTRSIDNAIKEVDLYTKMLVAKANIFIRRLGAVGIATVTDRSRGMNFDKSFIVENMGDGFFRGTLMVIGEELLFFEFGTGVTNNTYPSSHPKGAEMGMIIGEYGKGYGKLPRWRYKDKNGDWIPTEGWKAEMPVYHAYVDIVIEFRRIANEVFGV